MSADHHQDSTSTLIYDRETAPFTLDALKDLLLQEGKDIGCSIECCASTKSVASASDNRIGLLVNFGLVSPQPSGDSTLDTMQRLWAEGCRRFLVVSPFDVADCFNDLPAEHRGAFAEAVTSLKVAEASDIAATVNKMQSGRLPDWVEDRIARTFQARRIYSDLLSQFSHAAKADITNQFLAPARLLLGTEEGRAKLPSAVGEWRKLAQPFKERVIQRLQKDGAANGYGLLGQELLAAAEPVVHWLISDSAVGALKSEALDRLMALLTTCRVLAGRITKSQPDEAPTENSIPLPILSSAELHYKVLVIDDHAAAWRPVFEVLQERLSAANISVAFEFSIDAKNVRLQGQEQPAQLCNVIPDYDLILMDIFIGEEDGRKVLERLRRDFISVPVLLWTTSRDIEIGTRAVLANATLLKKSINFKGLAGTFSRWLPEGNAKRIVSIPSPLFHEAICNLEYRRVIRDFTKWCLKQMDSFHAVDKKYFRTYTDHGGRHFVKLVDLLESALKPFLQDETLFSPNPKAREEELFCLYLAVVCHELGMFPLNQVDEVGRFNEEKYHEAVRSFHSLRGMVLIMDPSGAYWPDGDGKALSLMLDKIPGDSVRLKLAILVCYHSRFLRSLAPADFLKWTPAAQNKFNETKEKGPAFDCHATQIQQCLKGISTVVDKDKLFKTRLARLCGLFRFVDAVDVDSSRNPALFLMAQDNRPEQRREYLKRQICDGVKIEGGRVMFDANAVIPSMELVHSALSWGDINGPKLRDKYEPSCPRVITQSALDDPWFEGCLSCLDATSQNQKVLDFGLETAFTWLKEGGEKPQFLDYKSFQSNGTDVSIGELTNEEVAIASLTALSVAWEILDEYRAIAEVGLQERIKLGEWNWKALDKFEPERITIFDLAFANEDEPQSTGSAIK